MIANPVCPEIRVGVLGGMFDGAGAALGWATVAALVVLGWWLAAALSRGSFERRLGQGAVAMGYAVIFVGALAVLVRAAAALGVMPSDPFAWTDALGLTYRVACLREVGTPRDLLLLAALVSALVMVPVAACVGLARRTRRRSAPYRVPFALPVAALLVLAAGWLLAVLHGWSHLLGDRGEATPLELLGALPVWAIGLVVWTRAREVADAEETEAVEPADAPHADVHAAGPVWQQSGYADGTLFAVEESFAPAQPGANGAVWAHVGGVGAHPGALDEVCDALADRTRRHESLLLGDLPASVDRTLLLAVAFRAAQVDGVPTLMVTDSAREARELAARLTEAMRGAGAWRCGPVVADLDALRHQLEGQQLPSVVFLSFEELSAGGLRLLSPGQIGARWARALGLVLSPLVDRGGPLVATQRVFVLQRLDLALHSVGASFLVLSTGLAGPGTRAALERAFPGFPVRIVPYRARARAGVRIFHAADGFRTTTGRSWLARAAEPALQHGLSIAVSDPLGTFDPASSSLDPTRAHVSRDVPFDGDASLAELDGAWFLTSYRAIVHVAPRSGRSVHESLWGFDDSPLVHFFCKPGVLSGLAQAGTLPAPRPLIGHRNGPLLHAHIQAAWRDGPRDLDSLRAHFDRSQVEAIISQRSGRYGLRYAVERRRLERAELTPEVASDGASPVRGTITENTASIVVEPGGLRLGDIDIATATTRYYPGRVFAVGGERFAVPMHALDLKRRLLTVQRASPGQPLNAPILRLAFEQAQPEPVHHVQSGKLRYSLATLRGMVEESVLGYRDRGPTPRQQWYDAPIVTRYPSRARLVAFHADPRPEVLHHLARMMANVLGAHLFAPTDAFDVLPVAAGFVPGAPSGLLIVDRHFAGMGLCEALDEHLIAEALRWIDAVLYHCPCMDGCPRCTPAEVLAVPGAARKGLVRVLIHS